jgi:hypothetical protein
MTAIKIVVDDGTSKHTGSTVVGPVAGTLTVGSDTFVTVIGHKVMVEDGTMVIPTHEYSTGPPPLYHSHNYAPNTFQQSFVKVNGKKVVLVGDNYSSDATDVETAGSNNFVTVTA